MTLLAAATATNAGETFLALAFLFGAGYFLLSFFFRRIGGKGGGSEKASIGAWFLLAAIIVGFLVATRR
jgi:hypothetical protein